MRVEDWNRVVDSQVSITAMEYPPADRRHLLERFERWALQRMLPLYYWNPGYEVLQQVQGGKLRDTEWKVEGQVILFILLRERQAGIYLIEGLINNEEVETETIYQLLNAHYVLSEEEVCHWVLLGDSIQLSQKLSSIVPVFRDPLPDRVEVEGILERCLGCEKVPSQLVRAAQGLSRGEIELIVQRFQGTVQELAQFILDQKVAKLRGLGLQFLAEPDVPTAAGLEQLQHRLEQIGALFDSTAQQHNLSCPKGLMLLGVPGSGKSLSAKLAARQLGIPLVAADWSFILGARSPDGVLKQLLEQVESLAPCVLFWDEFDKGFSGWESQDQGVARRLIGKLLVWMQEHQFPILTIATINRLNLVPVELQRRFEEIFFVDYPHNGARYEIFKLHLAKYFPAFRASDPWSQQQWQTLLAQYNLFSPAEIAIAVRRVAEEKYYQLYCQGQTSQPLEVRFEEMMAQAQKMVPLALRMDDEIQQMRNTSALAKKAAGPDLSPFARQADIRLFQGNSG